MVCKNSISGKRYSVSFTYHMISFDDVFLYFSESGTDKIAEFGVVCSKIPWIEYEMKGFQDGDGFYDVSFYLSPL